MTRGQLHAYQGEMAQAVAEWEIAYRIASSDVPRAMPLLEEVLGVGYLHKSEMDNDVYRNPGDRCIFPLRPELHYAQTASSAKAVQYFTKYLERKPDDIEVKWLLNLAYMTLGKLPFRRSAKILATALAIYIRRNHWTLHRRGSPGGTEPVRDVFRRGGGRFRE